MRKRKDETGNGGRRKQAKTLTGFYRQQKATAATAAVTTADDGSRKMMRETTTASSEDPKPPNVGEEEQSKGGFFACYLLISLNPRRGLKGRTYIGFTVNPRRRIRQHNGEIQNGASRTKNGRPWEMVLCIYGFPNNIAALQFEWAWQNPLESTTVRESALTFKSMKEFTSKTVANKIRIAHTMLTLRRWSSLNITMNYFSSIYTKHCVGCPDLPAQMVVRVGNMDDLPCYTGELQSSVPDKDDGDECDEASYGFDNAEETFAGASTYTSQDDRPDDEYEAGNSRGQCTLSQEDEYEAGNMRDLSTISLGDSCPLDSVFPRRESVTTEEIYHGGDGGINNTPFPNHQKKVTDVIEIEDDEELRPLRERLMVRSCEKSRQFEENRDGKIIAEQLPDVVAADAHPGLSKGRLSANANEKSDQCRENGSSTLRGEQFTDEIAAHIYPGIWRQSLLSDVNGQLNQFEDDKSSSLTGEGFIDKIEANNHSGLCRERPSADICEKVNKYSDTRPSSLTQKQFADTVDDYDDPPPLRERLLTASYEKFRSLVKCGEARTGDRCVVIDTDQIHSLSPDNSQIPSKPSTLTSLPDFGSASVDTTEIESSARTPVTAEEPREHRTCSNEKHTATQRAADEQNYQTSTMAHQAEVIDLLSPPSEYRFKSHVTDSRVSISSPDIIYLG